MSFVSPIIVQVSPIYIDYINVRATYSHNGIIFEAGPKKSDYIHQSIFGGYTKSNPTLSCPRGMDYTCRLCARWGVISGTKYRELLVLNCSSRKKMYWAHLGPKKPNTTKTMAIKKKKICLLSEVRVPRYRSFHNKWDCLTDDHKIISLDRIRDDWILDTS